MLDFDLLQKEITNEIRNDLLNLSDADLYHYSAIFEYQFGWSDSKTVNKGKRIRPLLLLLATHAVGGDWKPAIPAAAAIEMMHNFSLVHDDIQDKSLLRRGKDTVWVKWGEALAINAGDAMLAYALTTPDKLIGKFDPAIVQRVQTRMSEACIELTKGQFLDIHFEEVETVSLDLYFKMIAGKTCSLLQAALQIGAALGGADELILAKFKECGLLLGQAFQIQDDWLGIWGQDEITGKSSLSDLLTRKKTYPILSGLAKKQKFYQLWKKSSLIQAEMVPSLAQALAEDGVKDETEKLVHDLYRQTIGALNDTGCSAERVSPLLLVMQGLISREF